MSNGNSCIPVPGHYLDSLMATKDSLKKYKSEKIRIFVKDFKSIELNAVEHRAMMAIFSKYGEMGYNEESFKIGISFTLYELCKRMGYSQDIKGRFGGKAMQEALDALVSLSKRTFSVYFTKFLRKDQRGNVYDALIYPNCSLIDIVYSASDVTEEELLKGKVVGKITKIHLKVKALFYNKSYYRLFASNFYISLKSTLDKHNKRVTKYHWSFALWHLKQSHHKKPLEINVDKLAARLKIPCDSTHVSRARAIVRNLYEDFKQLNYISDYKINVPAQSGRTKDIITLAGLSG